MKITFKTNGGASAQLEVEPSMTLAEVKEKLAPLLELKPNFTRLIYKGRITKDTDTIDSIRIADGQTMHVVRKNVTPTPSESNVAPSAGTSSQANVLPTPTPTPQNPAGTNAGNAAPFANPFMGGMSSFGGMPNVNPQMLQQMLQNPMMQQMMQEMLRNPETLRSMLQSNPMIQSLTSANPMLREMLQNPEMLRSMFDPATLQAATQMYAGGNALNPAASGPPTTAPAATPDLDMLLSQIGMGSAASGTPNLGAMPDFSALLGGNSSTLESATGQSAGTTAPTPPAGNLMESMQNMMQDPQIRSQMQAFMQNMGGMTGGSAPRAPVPAPDGTPLTSAEETQYADASRQLEDMGFNDRSQNAWALRSTGGDVNAAINLLLEYSYGN